jgi:hypothetical protein
MTVYVYSVFVLFCVQVTDLRRPDPQSKDSYRLRIRLRNWKSGQNPTKGLYSHRQIATTLITGMIAQEISHCSDTPIFWTAECDGRYRVGAGNVRAMYNGRSVPVHPTMKTWAEVKVQLYAILTAALECGEQFASLSGRFTPEKWTPDTCAYETGWVSEAVSALWKKHCFSLAESRIPITL